MKRQALTLASCMTLCVASPAGGQSDPLAGTWTGHMGPAEPLGQAVTIELKRAGAVYSGTLTGPGLTPGDISDVTFDHASGALTFVVTVRGGDSFKVTFDGKLVSGVVTGRAIFPDQTGLFRITKGSSKVAVPPTNRPSVPLTRQLDPAIEAAKRGFTEVSGWVVRAAELVPAERYAFKPIPTVRSFGELVGHVADAFRYYCGRGAGGNTEWSDAIEKGGVTKAVVLPKLKDELEACQATYTGTNARIGPLMENNGHTNLHYGNMVTYMRMLGLVPPSS